ncbi:leucine-rich repeat-containing protein 40-like isoform X2 [Periplaneta americana]|uniref:leucine-rich repeat-containing protein 40-like isoform X2 n=1 Tax=Periplaneta americana TaxID=6978 RepID=UPI0037E80F29
MYYEGTNRRCQLMLFPEKVWQLDELDEAEVRLLEVRMDREVEGERWWEHEPLTWLDLSSNCITQISPKIKNLATLTVLNIHNNNLDSIPSELGCLTKLTRLNISHNKLTALPLSFFKLCELRSLQLSHNHLEVISDDIGDLVMLENLDISHNCLSILPPGIGFLTRLTQLDASHNKLIDVPPDLTSLRVLLKLDLSENQLSFLPPLGDLRKLEMLYLQHNQLVTLPDVTGCMALKELHLADNAVKEIDVEILEGLSRLRVLNLRDNKLELIPEEISSLQLLTRFDLTNNCLSTLPDIVGFLPHLQSLQLDGNPLRSIRRDIIQCGTSRILKFLRERCKGEGNITVGSESNFTSSAEVKFPDRYMMRNGRALSLAMQDLTEIPDSVFLDAVEAEVTSVDISKNKLKEVPLGLKNLASRITDLNVSCNLLTMISLELGLCQNLQYLDLQKNLLEDLPQSFECLTRLRELVIAFNKFSELPECVYKLPGLEILIARGNQLTKIDISGLSQLKRLATLDLADNNINHVPPELGNMTQLRCLELTGNSFRQPRHAILMKGTVSILSYLRDRIPQDQ